MKHHLPEVIERYLAAYNLRDVAGMTEVLTDDIEFEHVSAGSTNVRVSGREAFRELAKGSAGVFSSRTQTVTFSVQSGEHVTAMVTFIGTVATNMPNGWRAGQQVKLRGCTFFCLRGNAICNIVDFS